MVFLVFLFVGSIANAQPPLIHSFSPARGGWGTMVTITGSHLVNVTDVKFGGTPATYFYSLSDSSLIAGVDSAGSSGAVSVSTTAGTASKAGFTFLPSPVINGLSPTTGSNGDTINLGGIGLANVSEVYFENTPALSFTIHGDTLIRAVVGNGSSGAVWVMTTDSTYGYIDGFTHLGPEIHSFSPTAGNTGTVVTIRGLNFSGATSVKFGSVTAASFQVLSDTSIQATTAAGSKGAMEVATPRGVATMDGFNTPVISHFFHGIGTLGDTVHIFGTNLSGTTQVFFGDSAATGFTVYGDSMVSARLGQGASGFVRIVAGTDTAVSLYVFQFHPWIPQIHSFSPMQANEGTQVTIKGLWFTNATAVSFGGVAADSFTVVSDSIITATVGAGSSGNVSVVVNGHTTSKNGFTYLPTIPSITGFTPAAGPAGTVVTITGTGFHRMAANNTVKIGGINAQVVSATTTTITAIVPASARFVPISVYAAGHTGHSAKPFILTFDGGTHGLWPSTFNKRQNLATIGSNPDKVLAADIDGDGKNDLVTTYGYFGTNQHYVSVYRNISDTSGIVRFDTAINIVAGAAGYSGFNMDVADIDGDGKEDIIALTTGENIAGILRNTSMPGNISFAPKVDFVTGSPHGPEGTNPVNVTAADFDGDGRADLAFASYGLDNWCKVTYMRNTSGNGSISFGGRQTYPVVDAYSVFAGCLNDDNKPDIGIAIDVNGSFMKQVGILANTSTPGNISFARSEDIGAENSLKNYYLAYGDLDGDGKQDLVAANWNASTVSLFRNTTTGTYVTFAAPVMLTAAYGCRGVSIGDIDGDGKPDIVATVTGNNQVTIWKNQSVAGTLSFGLRMDYATGKIPAAVTLADLNGDNKPEIITANASDTSLSILVNKIGGARELCPSVASASFVSNSTGTSYQWQVSTDGSNFNNLSNSSQYSGVLTGTLHLNNIPSMYNGYRYRCVVDGVSGIVHTIRFTNTWKGSTNNAWNNPANWSCGVVPDQNTDVYIGSGNIVVSSNVVVRSLELGPGVVVTVKPGYTIIVKK